MKLTKNELPKGPRQHKKASTLMKHKKAIIKSEKRLKRRNGEVEVVVASVGKENMALAEIYGLKFIIIVCILST